MSEALPTAETRRPLRAIALLSAAAFVSTATVRVADPLLPLIAREFAVTPAGASVIATSAALAYGLFQIFYGSLGDRFGKFTVIAVATGLSALSTAAAALADNLLLLGLLRFVSGGTAAAVVPLAIAHIGDVVPYQSRQAMLARFLSGQILGVLFGQAAGGIFADYLGWRGIFLVLGALYLVIDALLWLELGAGRVVDSRAANVRFRGLPARYLAMLKVARVRSILAVASGEGFLFFGGLTYLGAFAHHEFALSFTFIGLILGCFGLGGLIYSLTVKFFVGGLGERRMAMLGGSLLALGFGSVAMAGVWWLLPPAVVVCGVGFYMHHNTLQTNATQMVPDARGLAISLFAFVFFLSQAAGVALCGVLIETAGYRPMFALVGALLLPLALTFASTLPRRAAIADSR
jgi:YNFM family putative membrane transporter